MEKVLKSVVALILYWETLKLNNSLILIQAIFLIKQ